MSSCSNIPCNTESSRACRCYEMSDKTQMCAYKDFDGSFKRCAKSCCRGGIGCYGECTGTDVPTEPEVEFVYASTDENQAPEQPAFFQMSPAELYFFTISIVVILILISTFSLYMA